MIKRAAARRRAVRNMAVVAALFGMAGLLIVLARFHTPAKPLGEPAELTAKRLDTQNNAYYVLAEAFEMLPEPPPVNPAGTPEQGSLAVLVGNSEVGEDALLEYFPKTRPAAEHALKALDKPFFLHPPTDFTDPDAVDIRAAWELKVRYLAALCQAQATILPCSDDPQQDACRWLHDAARLSRLIDNDGAGPLFASAALAGDVIRKASPNHQREIAAWLAQLRREWQPPSNEIDFLFRSIYAGGLPLEARRASFPERLFVTGVQALRKREIRRNEQLIRQAQSKTYHQLDWRTLLGIRQRQLYWLIHYNSLFFSDVDGLLVLLAIEAFRRDNATCPTTLDELVPRYLAELPVNAFNGKPYVYLPDGSDYILFYADSHFVYGQPPSNNYILIHAPENRRADFWAGSKTAEAQHD